MRQLRGVVLLLITALIWGLGFVAQSSAADSIGSFSFTAARSLIAAAFLLGLLGVRRLRPADRRPPSKGALRGGLLCGGLLFVASNLQQFGIAAYPPEAAASGRAGFLTATYVVMVALGALLSGRRLRLSVLASAVGCVAGMYLLCMSGGFGGVYAGDLLELACAVGFALYIWAVDRCAGLDSLCVSCVQFALCGVLSLAAALLFEDFSLLLLLRAWLPVLYAGVFSSGVGYTLQIIGQKYAEPTVASIVMSLESVFAALAGWLLLNERLSDVELCGCALVFLSVLAAQLPARGKGGDKAG